MAGISDFFDICANLYRFHGITDLNQIQKLAHRNNRWVNYNENLYFSDTDDMTGIDIIKYLPKIYSTIIPELNKHNNSPLVIALPHTNLIYLLIFSLIQYFFQHNRKTYIVDHPDFYHKNYYKKLNFILKESFDTEFIALKKGLTLPKIELKRNKKPVFIVFYDIPPAKIQNSTNIDFLNNNIYVSDTVLKVARYLQAPILPMITYLTNFKVQTQTLSCLNIINSDTNQHTNRGYLLKLFAPLHNLLTQDIDQWLIWKYFNLFYPVNKNNTAKKTEILQVSCHNKICRLNLINGKKIIVSKA